MKDTIATRFRTEWNRLRAKRSGIDHELAKLAFDIRAEFPAGHDGDVAFRDWCRGELGVPSSSNKMIEMAAAWDAVRSIEHWRTIGGIQSGRLLALLSKRQRITVLGEAIAKADGQGRPVSASIVRDIAWRHGFIEKRPTKATDAKRLKMVAAFVNRLYATQTGLPPMPGEISEIVKPPTAKIAKAAKAA